MADIYEWLESINAGPIKKSSLKRAYPLSPKPAGGCPSPHTMTEASTPTKRRRHDHGMSTPRAAILDPTAPRSPSSSPKKSSASFRSNSQASSSRLRFSYLDVGHEGLVRRQMSGLQTPNLPPAVRDVLLKIQQLDRLKGVLCSTADKADFEAFRRNFDLDLSVFADEVGDGSRLTCRDASEIEADARRCFEMDHDEPVWNAEVHNPLLKKIFRKNNSSPKLVDFSLCTTASVIREYLPATMPNRRVDFCLYINPSCDAQYAAKVSALRQQLPETSINHTSYTALHGYPAAVSLETKRSGNDFDGAVLQIAVWQAAHWKMLRSLLQRAARSREADCSDCSICDDTVSDHGNATKHVDASLCKLGALHGIYSQGHEWYYVATSPEMVDSQGRRSLRTILWLHEPIGRTNSALGIHRIAAFLEHMKKWSASCYWPWFKQHVLDGGSC